MKPLPEWEGSFEPHGFKIMELCGKDPWVFANTPSFLTVRKVMFLGLCTWRGETTNKIET